MTSISYTLKGIILLLYCLQIYTSLEYYSNNHSDPTSTYKEDNYENISVRKSNALIHDSNKIKSGKKAALSALRAVSSENCDWRTNPIALMKGEVCGRYYKILGIGNRHEADIGDIKRSYRLKSKSLHPDKNPSGELAQEAFTYLREGYECLTDENCKRHYDYSLTIMEQDNLRRRKERLAVATKCARDIVEKTHYYTTFAASMIDQAAGSVWDRLGTIRVFDVQLGRVAGLVYAALYRKGALIAVALAKLVLLFNQAVMQSVDRVE